MRKNFENKHHDSVILGVGDASTWRLSMSTRGIKTGSTANIRFGRIDYAVADECIQVWEINTNPRLESIMLSSSAITDESLTPLAGSMSLEHISMERTQVTNKGVDDVREDLIVPPSGSNWLAGHSRKYCRLPRSPPRGSGLLIEL